MVLQPLKHYATTILTSNFSKSRRRIYFWRSFL